MRSSLRATVRVAPLFLMAVGFPIALAAQGRDANQPVAAVTDSLPDLAIHTVRATGCLATLTSQSMHRAPVFLVATTSPHTDSTFTLQADLIAQDVAAEIREALGARDEEAPIADGKILWYSVPTQIVVTATRAGEMRWRARGLSGDSSATSLLSRAFDAAHARGTLLIAWPDNSKADSVQIRLSLVAEPIGGENAIYPLASVRVKFTVFLLSVPDEALARLTGYVDPPKYPEVNERARIEGSVITQLEIDSTGRVVPSSVHELWPPNLPRPVGESRREHDAFVESVFAWDKRLRFVPARVGVCPVAMVSVIPLLFRASGFR